MKFREAQSILEANKIQTFSQMEKDDLPTAMVKLNQLQPIQSVEKIFKKIELPSSLGQKVPPHEQANPEANKVFLMTFVNEIDPAIVIRELRKNPEVEYAEPNYIYHATFTPNDPYFLDSYPNNVGNRDPNWNPPYDYQWNLKKIGFPQAWDLSGSATTTIVAVVDSGVDYTHPEFGSCTLEQLNNNGCPKLTPGWNFVNDTNDPQDDAFHGNHVAGIITSLTNNNLGIASFDKSNLLRVMPLKALNYEGDGWASWLAKAITYAIESGAQVINMSWGGPGHSLLIDETIQRGVSKGVVFVAAAGNDHADVSQFHPANVEGVIAVSATDETDTIASYSNYGPKIAISAPGGSDKYNLLSLAPLNAKDILPPDLKEKLVDEQYLRMSGTSMACPHVAALAALIRNKNPQLTIQGIRNIIFNSADDLGEEGFDILYGYGRINAARALNEMDISEPPQARISFPQSSILVGRDFTVYGLAAGRNFESYAVSYSTTSNCHLTSGDYTSEGVIIEQPHLPVASNGLLATVHLPNSVENSSTTPYCLKLVVKANQKQISVGATFHFDKNVALGWPVLQGTLNLPSSQLLLADINQNQQKEVVLGSLDGTKLFAYDSTGHLLPHFPLETHLSGDIPILTPASWAENLFLPILSSSNTFQILGWSGEDGQSLPGWAKESWAEKEYLGSTPDTLVLADVNNDNQKEIIYAEAYSSDPSSGRHTKIHVFDRNHHYLPGWEGGVDFPKQDDSPYPYADYESGLLFSPLVGNVIGGPTSPKEIVIFFNDWSAPTFYKSRRVAIFSHDGMILTDFNIYPKNLLGETVKAALGDINKDGVLEIIISTEGETREIVTAWNGEGRKIFGYSLPQEYRPELRYANTLSLADFNSDTYPEIFLCTNGDKGMCAVIDGQGRHLSGFPVSKESGLFPTEVDFASIALLKNNQVLIATTELEKWHLALYATVYDSRTGQLSLVKDYPKFFLRNRPEPDLDFYASISAAVITDLDKDNRAEIVVSTFLPPDSYTYVFRSELELKDGTIEWSQYHNDEGHTGAYHSAQAPPQKCRTCSNFTGCLVGKTCMQQCQTNPDQYESKPCEAGAACTCRSGAPEEYRCPP